MLLSALFSFVTPSVPRCFFAYLVVLASPYSCALSPNGTTLTKFVAVDDDNDPLEFILLDDSGGPFTLTPAGTLYVDYAKGDVNYERRSTFAVVVEVHEVSTAVPGSLLLHSIQVW